MNVRLIVCEGKHKDREIPLPPTVFLIGRGRQCHLRPHCGLVSKLHCAIARWSGKILVRDLKSANGTFVNKERVEHEVQVFDGSELQVGKLVFAFRVMAEHDPFHRGTITDADETRWLLESPSDSAVLEPASRTCRLPAPELVDRVQFDTLSYSSQPNPGSGAVSAGEYLRDYYRTRKQALSGTG